jgi:hypothetical protein
VDVGGSCHLLLDEPPPPLDSSFVTTTGQLFLLVGHLTVAATNNENAEAKGLIHLLTIPTGALGPEFQWGYFLVAEIIQAVDV